MERSRARRLPANAGTGEPEREGLSGAGRRQRAQALARPLLRPPEGQGDGQDDGRHHRRDHRPHRARRHHRHRVITGKTKRVPARGRALPSHRAEQARATRENVLLCAPCMVHAQPTLDKAQSTTDWARDVQDMWCSCSIGRSDDVCARCSNAYQTHTHSFCATYCALSDFDLANAKDVPALLNSYVFFFNIKRCSASLDCKRPVQFRAERGFP